MRLPKAAHHFAAILFGAFLAIGGARALSPPETILLLQSAAPAPVLPASYVENFTTESSLSSNVAFSRASSASYFNSSGVLSSASTNAPRFDYNPATLVANGLLIEAAATNIALQSANLAAASWSPSADFGPAPTVTGNFATAPDGTTSAAKIVYPAFSAAGDFCVVYQVRAGTAATYSDSIWLEGASGGEVVYLSATTDGVNFYRVNATLTTAWQRFSVSGTQTAVGWTFEIGDDLRDSSQSAISAQTIYAWGAQRELGSFATSYIPTTTSAVARAADSASLTSAAATAVISRTSSLAGTVESSGDTVTNNYGAGSFPSTFPTGNWWASLTIN